MKNDAEFIFEGNIDDIIEGIIEVIQKEDTSLCLNEEINEKLKEQLKNVIIEKNREQNLLENIKGEFLGLEQLEDNKINITVKPENDKYTALTYDNSYSISMKRCTINLIKALLSLVIQRDIPISFLHIIYKINKEKELCILSNFEDMYTSISIEHLKNRYIKKECSNEKLKDNCDFFENDECCCQNHVEKIIENLVKNGVLKPTGDGEYKIAY